MTPTQIRKIQAEEQQRIRRREALEEMFFQGFALVSCCRCMKTVFAPENTYFITPWHQSSVALGLGCSACYEAEENGPVELCACCQPPSPPRPRLPQMTTEFQSFLAANARKVATWPAWKQRAMGDL